MTDHAIELVWHGDHNADLDEIVIKDIYDELLGPKGSGLKKASHLIIHTVFLGPIGDNAPTVEVWGVENDHRFHCQYYPDESGVMHFPISDLPEDSPLRKAIEKKQNDDG